MTLANPTNRVLFISKKFYELRLIISFFSFLTVNIIELSIVYFKADS